MSIERFQYLLLMAGCLAITLPLELLMGARVYRRPKRLLLALAPTVALFAVWDVWGIVRGHWWYSERFMTGWMVGPIPLEELVFFVVVPICGLLTLEAVGRVLAWGRAGMPLPGGRRLLGRARERGGAENAQPVRGAGRHDAAAAPRERGAAAGSAAGEGRASRA